MGGKRPPMTVEMIDELGRVRRKIERLVTADGVVTLDEAQVQSELRYLAALARDIDEARLNAVSYLDYGELTPYRERRMREIAAEDADDAPEAA